MGANTEEIWNNMSQSLIAYIHKRVSNVHDAEDILQTVFTKIHVNIDTVKDEKKLYSWIYRITKNAIIDHYRENNDHVELDKIEQLLETENESQDLNGDIVLCLKSMINCLPDKYREAVLLSELGGITQKELSEKLGLSVSGAKSRVQRARQLLKTMMIDCCKLQMDCYGNVIDYERNQKSCKFC